MKQKLRPLMLCPFCEHYESWDTSERKAVEWDKHIRECRKAMRKKEKEIEYNNPNLRPMF